MTLLALGRRQLAAHPPYGNYSLMCVVLNARVHVHVTSSVEPHYYMPDGCAACGREWFAEDEITYMGYCGDCWPGNAMLLDYTDATECVAATYPQPVRHRAPSAQGQAKPVYLNGRLPDCRQCRFLILSGQVGQRCEQHRWADIDNTVARDHWSTASADPYICPDCGSLADLWHSVKCPQYSRQM